MEEAALLCTTRTTSLACVKKSLWEVAANVGPCVVIGLSKFMHLEMKWLLLIIEKIKRVPWDRLRYSSCTDVSIMSWAECGRRHQWEKLSAGPDKHQICPSANNDGVSKYVTWYKLRALVGACLMHTFKMSSRKTVLKSKIDQRARLTCVVLISYISVAFWGDSVVSAEVDFHPKKEDKLGDSDATRFDSSWRRESREIRRFSSRIQLADSMSTSLINFFP